MSLLRRSQYNRVLHEYRAVTIVDYMSVISFNLVVLLCMYVCTSLWPFIHSFNDAHYDYSPLRICRLKKKAFHEANKIKYTGLGMEYREFLSVSTSVEANRLGGFRSWGNELCIIISHRMVRYAFYWPHALGTKRSSVLVPSSTG